MRTDVGAILVMAYLAHVGRIPRTEAHAYLRETFATMQPQAARYVWVGWAECVALLGFADLAPSVRQLFDRRFPPSRAHAITATK